MDTLLRNKRFKEEIARSRQHSEEETEHILLLCIRQLKVHLL